VVRLQYPEKISELKKNTPRESFLFEIKIGGKLISNFKFDNIVKSIKVVMSDDKIDSVKINFVNTHDYLLNDELFVTGQSLELWLGYQTYGLKYIGYFVIVTPSFNIANSSNVVVEAYAKGILLTQEEKRTSYHNVTDSKIAQEIANQYGFKPDIQETFEQYKMVIQGNQNDYVFLQERANKNGFLFYIENNTLHFHKKKTLALDFSLLYQRGIGSIRECMIKVLGIGKNALFYISDIEPLTGKIINADASFEIDDQVDRLSGVRDVDSYSFRKKRYLVGEGQNRNLKELSDIVSSATSASRYSVELKCSINGIELIKPSRIININGLMRFSGLYYIKECQHYWNKELGYINKLVAYRTFIEPFDAESVSKLLGFENKREKGHVLKSTVQVG